MGSLQTWYGVQIQELYFFLGGEAGGEVNIQHCPTLVTLSEVLSLSGQVMNSQRTAGDM